MGKKEDDPSVLVQERGGGRRAFKDDRRIVDDARLARG
jgi:hypothetical protein